jgi:hypothetical protein
LLRFSVVHRCSVISVARSNCPHIRTWRSVYVGRCVCIETSACACGPSSCAAYADGALAAAGAQRRLLEERNPQRSGETESIKSLSVASVLCGSPLLGHLRCSKRPPHIRTWRRAAPLLSTLRSRDAVAPSDGIHRKANKRSRSNPSPLLRFSAINRCSVISVPRSNGRCVRNIAIRVRGPCVCIETSGCACGPSSCTPSTQMVR